MPIEREDTQYKQIADSVNALVYTIAQDSYKMTYANHVTQSLFGEIQEGCLCYNMLFGREEPCVKCPMKVLSTQQKSIGACMFMEKISRWIQVEYNDCTMQDGRHLCVCTGVDISHIKSAARVTEQVLNSIDAAAYTVDLKDYHLRFVNQELRNMLPGINEGDLCYEALWNNHQPCGHCPLPHLTQENARYNMEVYNEKLKKYLRISGICVMDNKEPVVIFTGYDITGRMEYENKLKHMAYYDVQLGIKNRTAFMDELSSMLEAGKQGIVCVTNLKNFSRYNSVYGRQFGDHILEEIVKYYSGRYPAERLYRVGGARFALIAESPEQSIRLRHMMETRKFPEESKKETWLHIFSDCVVIEFPRFASSPEMLAHHSEYILRKHQKRDSSEVFYFRQEEQRQIARKSKIAAMIRKKIDDKEFEVYYQPIYSVLEETFFKSEALLRLYDQELGWIPPLEFIPIAEESGLISELGEFVLETVCQMLASREQRGLPPIQVNVNISTVQFCSISFFESTMSILEKYRIDPAQIRLEVTESIMIHSLDSIIGMMRRFIERGITFWVDDFGTGYSGLNYIGTLPVEGIKLDKSFIDHISDSEIYLLIVKNIIEIAKGLHFKVVAEGVEQAQQYELLKRMGCDYIQGYFFAKPLPLEDFTEFLK